MFDTIEQARLHALHIFSDADTQLRAIVAIHNTRLGPALGGCRFLHYPSYTHALEDAIRLAQGMSYKAALAGLPLGGGKAVIIKPQPLFDRAALLRAFGRCIEQLKGQYITSVDSGTSSADMDEIQKTTSHVTATGFHHVNPSPNTALGVFYGIQAALAHRFGDASLAGRHVAIQGVGNVGKVLAQHLHNHGATLTLSDTDPSQVKHLASRLNAQVVAPEHIFDVPCDVFAPCGLGGILNANTLPRLRCHIVAGAANNQLASPEQDDWLFQHRILYAPDFVINAGGLIQVASEKRVLETNSLETNVEHVAQDEKRDDASQQDDTPQQKAVKYRTQRIRDTLHNIFTTAEQQQQATGRIATALAERLLFPYAISNTAGEQSTANPIASFETRAATPHSATGSVHQHVEHLS
ncbi:MAG: Glu/Leu/Phe/Val dehydrogenase dimerization domain-containing protein [Gammaproteobacteria bacterium]